MKLWIVGCIIAFTLAAASTASAAYVTIENTWPDGDTWTRDSLPTTGSTINFFKVWLTLYDADSTNILIISGDYGYKKVPHATPTTSLLIPIDITQDHVIPAGGMFTSKKLIGVPDEGFLFGAGVAGIGGGGPGFGYSTVQTDPSPGQFSITPGLSGSDSFYFTVYRADGSTINVAKVTFYPGNPSAAGRTK